MGFKLHATSARRAQCVEQGARTGSVQAIGAHIGAHGTLVRKGTGKAVGAPNEKGASGAGALSLLVASTRHGAVRFAAGVDGQSPHSLVSSALVHQGHFAGARCEWRDCRGWQQRAALGLSLRHFPQYETGWVCVCGCGWLMALAGARHPPRPAGSVSVTQVPCPGALATSTWPPCNSAMRLTMARPSPLPPSPVAGATFWRLW